MFSRRLVLAGCLGLLIALLTATTASRAAAAETVLVQAGSNMSYLANAANPGIGITWTAESFVPSGWGAGVYGVGYETGTGAAALITTNVGGAKNSVYTRTTFTVADVSAVNNIFLGADYDDGYVAWINGVEVFRSSEMPADSPAWDSTAALHESSNGAAPNYAPLRDVSAAALPALHNGTNVLAIGVWNVTLPSTDLVLVPKLLMNADVSVSRGPYLQTGTPTSVIVRWRTNIASTSCVRYGAAPGSLTLSSCSGTPTTEHAVIVSGLAAATKYYYSVGTTATTLAGGTADYSVVTPPTTGTTKATRVWVLGDSGTATTDAQAVRDAYIAFTGATPTDLWLMLGDNAYNSGTDSEFQTAVFETYPETLRQSVLWPTMGNHDSVSASSVSQTGPYYSIFNLPTSGQAGGIASSTEAYYSFDHGDIHFICLESDNTDATSRTTMQNWVVNDLAATTAKWVITFFHHPPYSKGSHNSDSASETRMTYMRTTVLPLLEQGGVDLVLTGHSHSYERSFLLDGHYGVSSTLSPGMILDAGSGRETGSGAYQKSPGSPSPHDGAVYVVAGSSGQVTSAALNHPAMYISLAKLGSLILDFDDDRLDVKFIDDAAVVQDYFTINKASASACGNGIVEAGEACDDANNVNTDACTNSCAVAFCGDGIVRAGVEACDDGNNVNTDACPNTCISASCGDGLIEAGSEDCDDANSDNSDSCLNTCIAAICGDGFIRVGVEACDDANAENSDACTNACATAVCGDGFVQASVEQCDDGNAIDTDACANSCVSASCGDGIVQIGTEACDDANSDNADACLNTCLVASCGDGFIQAGVEACDDANADNTEACTNTCAAATCGDGFVRAGVEECDDGNLVAGDGCSPDCFSSCSPQPRNNCREAGVSILKIVKGGTETRDLVKWKWLRGPEIAASSLGDPTLDASYDVCFYPDVPGTGAMTGEVQLAPGNFWSSRGERGLSYQDRTSSNGGISVLQLATGAERKTKLILKARGVEVPDTLLPANAYTLQLVDRTGGGCWSSEFATGFRSAALFRGKTIAP